MRYFRRRAIGSILILFPVAGMLAACSTTPSKEEVTKAVKKQIPVEHEVLAVRPVKEVAGLNEVVIRFSSKQVAVVYVDKKGKYLFMGNVMDVATGKNLTLETQKQFSQR